VADPRDLTIDRYAPLSHKSPLHPSGTGSLAPSWIPARERRRLDAYRILAAYTGNVVRWFDRDDPEDPTAWEKRREYGDAGLIVRRVRSAVLGDEMQIVIDGADDDLPAVPEIPDQPEAPTGDEASPQQRIHRIALQRWTDETNRLIDEWEAALTAAPALQARQEWLRTWADLEQLKAKAVETEDDAVGLGDGIYALFPDTTKGRPTLTSYDPGFYFPVLDDSTLEQFPDKLHFAWEFEVDQPDGRIEHFVRRLTWELVPVATAVAAMLPDDPDTDFGEAYAANVAGDVNLIEWTTPHGSVELRRWYPWQDQGADDAEPSGLACVFSDGTWPLDEVRGSYADLADDKAAWAALDDGRIARQLSLGVDFIPVVHVPNTPSTREHFGASVLLLLAQLLDDISQGDTDLQGAAGIAALPIVGMFGAEKADELALYAGAILSSKDPQGSLTVVDLAGSIPALRELQGDLLERLSVNGSIPAEVLGRTTGADSLSGISRLLKQGTFKQLIEELRLTRAPKYALLLKMVQRMAQAMGTLPAGQNPEASMVFGSYLPSDLASIVELVDKLLRAHGISRRTSLELLIAAGLDVADIGEELSAIAAEDTEGADRIANATSSEAAAAKYLGVELPEQPTVGAPTVTLPGGPGDGGEGA
jgi:hypothetical protein